MDARNRIAIQWNERWHDDLYSVQS
jgi:hypothetical protein